MGHQNILFQQLQQQFSGHDFKNLISRFFSANSSRNFSHKNHFSFLMFCIINNVKSLREGVDTFNNYGERLYHIGFNQEVKLSTVSEANSKRTYQCYEEFFKILLGSLKKSHQKLFSFPLEIMDSSIVSLGGKKSDWAKYNKNQNAIKIHVILDGLNSIPLSVDITHGNVADIKVARDKDFLPGTFCVMDRAYFDAKWLYKHNKNGVFFAMRLKKNIIYHTIKTTVLNEGNVVEEKIIQLMGPQSQNYCESLRAITIHDDRKNEDFMVVTNNKDLPAEAIAELYRNRWKIELFFKWLKQKLKIKTVLGFSENAIKLQIWIAMITYLLIWLLYQKNRHKFDSLLTFFRYLRSRIFLRDKTIRFSKWLEKPPNQWLLFEEKIV